MSGDTTTTTTATQTPAAAPSDTTTQTQTPAQTPAQAQQAAAKTASTGASTAAGAKTEGAPADPAAGAGAPPWQDALPDGLKTDPLFRGYKTVDDLAKAHRHLTDLKGVPANELLRIPAKTRDQDAEAWKAFDAVRGVPDDPAAYDIPLAPEAAADTPALEKTLRDLGATARLDPFQMGVVIETLNTLGQEAAKAEAAALTAQTAETTATLKTEWGAAYEGHTRAIGKLMRDALGGKIDEAAMADLEAATGSNLTLMRVLAHAVTQMAEPETPEGGAAGRSDARQLTPAAAQAAINALYADPNKMKALNDRAHPQHAAVLQERQALLAQARGEKRPDQV